MHAPPLPWLIALVIGSLGAGEARAAEVTTRGEVRAVTVFQGQALVTRVIDLPAGEGLVEVVVTDLPSRLLPGSLYAEPEEGVEVRSVRTRVRPSGEAPRAEVKRLEDQIAEFEQRTRALKRERQLLAERARYLGSLDQFTSDTARAELAQGVLNADTLRELTTLIFSERAKLAERELEIDASEREIASQRQLADRELETLTTGGDRTVSEAVVFLNKQAGAATVRLKYLVGGANWSPSYNVRAKGDRTGVTLEYNASVTQMSGEDWSDVAMTLSTASPSLVATAPTLDPLEVRLAAITPAGSTLRKSKDTLSREQKTLAANRGNAALFQSASEPTPEDGNFDQPSPGGGVGGGGFGALYAVNATNVLDVDRGLNTLGCALQLIDLQAGGEPSRPLPSGGDSSEGISVVYRLPNKTSLPSRSDKQLIQIASLPLEADFYRVAMPVLTSYVYQEAELTNATDHVLLAGPSATFLGDRFVGRGEIPQASIGESFTVGLGIDESLRVGRELVNKTDRVQGGNRVAQFDYRLTLENFGDEAVGVRLLDRLPKSDGGAIKVTLLESDPSIDKDLSDTDKGLLHWDVEVPANATRADALTVSYSMQIEHDKNLRIVQGE